MMLALVGCNRNGDGSLAVGTGDRLALECGWCLELFAATAFNRYRHLIFRSQLIYDPAGTTYAVLGPLN